MIYKHNLQTKTQSGLRYVSVNPGGE